MHHSEMQTCAFSTALKKLVPHSSQFFSEKEEEEIARKEF